MRRDETIQSGGTKGILSAGQHRNESTPERKLIYTSYDRSVRPPVGGAPPACGLCDERLAASSHTSTCCPPPGTHSRCHSRACTWGLRQARGGGRDGIRMGGRECMSGSRTASSSSIRLGAGAGSLARRCRGSRRRQANAGRRCELTGSTDRLEVRTKGALGVCGAGARAEARVGEAQARRAAGLAGGAKQVLAAPASSAVPRLPTAADHHSPAAAGAIGAIGAIGASRVWADAAVA